MRILLNARSTRMRKETEETPSTRPRMSRDKETMPSVFARWLSRNPDAKAKPPRTMHARKTT